MNRFASSFVLAVCSAIALLVAACGGDAKVCTPGASVACIGTGGCMGGQVCNAAGTALGACMCAAGDGGGTPDAGTTDLGMPDSGAIDAGAADTGAVDSGAPDAATADAGTEDLGTPDLGTADICGSGLTTGDMTCDACLGANCCTETMACIADPVCLMCINTPMPSCSTNPQSVAFTMCIATSCASACPMLMM